MNIVRELRLGRGMQQKEVAIAAGVSRPVVSEWEHQKKDPSGERLMALAELFQVAPGVILGFKETEGNWQMTPAERELWRAREAAAANPERRILFQLATYGSDAAVKQASSIIRALRETNPDFYDGDDPS